MACGKSNFSCVFINLIGIDDGDFDLIDDEVAVHESLRLGQREIGAGFVDVDAACGEDIDDFISVCARGDPCGAARAVGVHHANSVADIRPECSGHFGPDGDAVVKAIEGALADLWIGNAGDAEDVFFGDAIDFNARARVAAIGKDEAAHQGCGAGDARCSFDPISQCLIVLD